MKILIVSQCFYPEEFRINDLVASFVEKGHQVTVLTGKPNYPKGEYFAGYKFWGVQRELYQGAHVIRVPVIRRGRGGGFKLAMNYLSFVIFGCWYVLTHKIEVDTIFCFAPSPITQVYPALIAKYKTKAKASLWVQDLWPDSVVAVGAAKQGGVMWNMLNWMVTSIYRHCDLIFIQSKAFKQSICAKGNFEDKIVYAPNWAEDLYINTIGDQSKYHNLIPNGFIVMFAGNIGAAQDFDSILNAAELTQSIGDIKWVIVGDGRVRAEMERKCERKGLTNTVKFVGRFNSTEMPHFFIHADIMLVSLKHEDIFACTIPSKIQTYMAAGKPIVSMLDGVGNDIIEEAGCGLTAGAGDYRTLANNVIRLYKSPKTSLEEMSVCAKQYYNLHFDKKYIVDRILTTIK